MSILNGWDTFHHHLSRKICENHPLHVSEEDDDASEVYIRLEFQEEEEKTQDAAVDSIVQWEGQQASVGSCIQEENHDIDFTNQDVEIQNYVKV